MTTLLLTLAIFAIFFVFLSLRMLLGKDESVRGTCASQSPFLQKEGSVCGFCGKTIEECPNEQQSEKKPVGLPN